MQTATSIIASGIWLALPLTGYAALKKYFAQKSLQWSVVFSLSAAAGICIWSIPLAVLAAVGLYNGVAVGAVGWLVVIIIVVRSRWRRRQINSPPSPIDRSEIILLSGLFVAAFIYCVAPRECIIGGRDMGVYTNHALYIASHGSLQVNNPWAHEEIALLDSVAEPYPGTYARGEKFYVQFTHVFPVWLAQAYSSFGFYALIRLNGVLALFALCIFYGLCRSIMAARYAILATLFLAVNPAMVWIARVTLTEILTLMLVLSALHMMVDALENKESLSAGWGGFFFGMATWIRVDSFLIIPIIIFVHLLHKILTQPDSSFNVVWKRFYSLLIVTSCLALAFHLLSSLPYLVELRYELSMIALLLTVMVVLFFVVKKSHLPSLHRALSSRAIIASVLILLVGISIVAYFVRPHLRPFSIISMPDHPLDGSRDYREDSLVNLGKYVTPLVLFTALVGWAVSFWQMMRKGQSLWILPISVVFVGFTFLYVWRPSIAPDHFWAIRRYIPIVIPGLIFFSSLAFSILDEKLSKWKSYVMFILLASVLVYYTARANAPFIFFQENGGYYQQLKEFANKLPDNELIFSDDNNDRWAAWETPLFFAFNKRIVPVDFDAEASLPIIRNWIEHETSTGKKVVVLYESDSPLKGFKVTLLTEVTLDRKYIAPTNYPLPDGFIQESRRIHIYEVSGVEHDFIGQDLGASHYFGIIESGFYPTEMHGTAAARWTEGAATLFVPIDSGRIPNAVKITLLSSSPGGSMLNILLNHVSIFNQKIDPGPFSQTIALDSIPLANLARIDLLSDTFVPEESVPGSNDTRRLGVLVGGIKLCENYLPLNSTLLDPSSCHSFLKVEYVRYDRSQDQAFLKFTLKNLGKQAWVNPSDLGADGGSIRIGVMWFATNNSRNPIFEQRVDLPSSLQPGEEVTFISPLTLQDNSGKLLPDGEYELKLGLLQEGNIWFYHNGDNLVRFTLNVKHGAN